MSRPPWYGTLKYHQQLYVQDKDECCTCCLYLEHPIVSLKATLQIPLMSLPTVRNVAVWDFQCGMHKWSQWSTTGWAFWCGNYCREPSRFTAEVRNSFSRGPGCQVSRENEIHLAEWLQSCSGQNITLQGNRRCKSNHINLRWFLNTFFFYFLGKVFNGNAEFFQIKQEKKADIIKCDLKLINNLPHLI